MRQLLQDDSGATLTEYGLMLLFVAIGAFLAVQAFGVSVRGLFDAAVSVVP
jgi:Flp pilus assembly pilin Flp